MKIGRKKGNRYFIEGNSVRIEIIQRNGNIHNVYIDKNDFDCVIKNFGYTWFVHWHETSKKYYVEATIHLGMENGKQKNKTERLHMLLLNPEHNPEIVVDHIDGDTMNNRRSNLRAVHQTKNARNRNTMNCNNKTGYRNVAYISQSKQPYWVQIMVDNKNTVLGKFDDVDEAGEYAKEMRKKYYGKYSGTV